MTGAARHRSTRALAEKIINNTNFVIPEPMEMDEMEKLVVQYGLVD